MTVKWKLLQICKCNHIMTKLETRENWWSVNYIMKFDTRHYHTTLIPLTRLSPTRTHRRRPPAMSVGIALCVCARVSYILWDGATVNEKRVRLVRDLNSSLLDTDIVRMCVCLLVRPPAPRSILRPFLPAWLCWKYFRWIPAAPCKCKYVCVWTHHSDSESAL